jgi:hypothetical protein
LGIFRLSESWFNIQLTRPIEFRTIGKRYF